MTEFDEAEARLDARAARMEELRVAIRRHPGTEASRMWARLRRTRAILAANMADFLALVEEPSRNSSLALKILGEEGAENDVQQRFFDEVDQRLHNAVAAIGTLIDHSRIVADRYEGQLFRQEYQDRVNAIRALPAAQFVRDLRNYLMHESLPSPFNEVGLSPTEVTFKLTVSVEDLLESSVWRAPVKRWLAEHGDYLEIREPFFAYTAALDQLYNWMFEQFGGLHDDEIEEANTLIDEYNDVLTGRRR